MKNRSLVFSVLLLAAGATFAFQNEPDGFRGIKWGTKLSAHAREMTLKEKSQDETYYTRRGDKMALGAAKLSELSYGYWNDQLVAIIIETSGVENRTALIAEFRKQYGPGTKPSEFLDEYAWRGDVSRISLKCSPSGQHCRAFMFSTQLIAKQKEQRQKKK